MCQDSGSPQGTELVASPWELFELSAHGAEIYSEPQQQPQQLPHSLASMGPPPPLPRNRERGVQSEGLAAVLLSER